MSRKPRVLFLFDLWVISLSVISILPAAFVAYAFSTFPSVREVPNIELIINLSIYLAGIGLLLFLGLAFRIQIARLAAIGISASFLIISLLALGLWFTQIIFPWPGLGPDAIGLQSLCSSVAMGAFFLAGLSAMFDPAVEERFRKPKRP
jgi:hypothetical protein